MKMGERKGEPSFQESSVFKWIWKNRGHKFVNVKLMNLNYAQETKGS